MHVLHCYFFKGVGIVFAFITLFYKRVEVVFAFITLFYKRVGIVFAFITLFYCVVTPIDVEFLPSCTVSHAVNSIFRCEKIFASSNVYLGPATCR